MSWLDGPLLDDLLASQRAARSDPADPVAVDELRRRYRRLLTSDALRRRLRARARRIMWGSDPDDIDDAVASAWERLTKLAESELILGVQSWAGWIDTVISRRVLDFVRRGRPTEPLEQEPVDDDGASPEEDALAGLGRPADRRIACLRSCRELMGKRPTQRRRLVAASVWSEHHGEADNASLCAMFNERSHETVKVNAFEKLVERGLHSLSVCVHECMEEGRS